MSAIFLEILNNSITASYLIIAVIILRFILKKAPKWSVCLLWGMVAMRLLLPFQIESGFSLIPDSKPIQLESNPNVSTYPMEQSAKDALWEQYIQNVKNMDQQENQINKENLENFTEDKKNSEESYKLHFFSKDFMNEVMKVASWIWVIGSFGFIIYAMVSFFRLKQKVAASIKLYDNIYLCDEIDTPFVLGIIKPCIYLSSKTPKEVGENILMHEKAHIQRGDHLWKILGYILLVIYWFNPLSWTAYISFCKDIELACDEKATRDMDKEQRADYCQALLKCSANSKLVEVYPVAFGEVGVKERIKQVLNYKKPSFWMILLAVIVCILVAVCFMTNPENKNGGDVVISEETELISELNWTTNGQEMSENIAEYDHIEPDVGTTQQAKTEFTMEDLIALCDAGNETLKSVMTNFSEDGELPYSNFEKRVSEYSLTWDYLCILPYEDREYRIQISYWKPEEAEEYGHTANELDGIYLSYPTTKDMQLLYASEERFTPDLDIRSFLEKEYDLELHAELDLPDSLKLGDYQMDLTLGQGCLFEGDYKEQPHGEGTPKDWYAPGGIEFIKKEYFPGEIRFEDGKLEAVIVHMNHSGSSSEFEFLEDCDMQAVLCEYSCDLFTAAESEEYMQEHGIAYEEFRWDSRYWYVFFAQEDSEYVYTLMLNQEYFDKEDMIELARSVKFRVK